MEHRSNEVLAVAGLFLVLTWLTSSLRVYVRSFPLSNTWGKDDWFMVATTLIFTVYLACQMVTAVYGTGRDRGDMKDDDRRVALFFWFICELLYILTSYILRLSLLLLYLRVAIQRCHIWTIRITMMGTVLFGITCFFLFIFQCSPINEYWNSHSASDKCFPEGVTTVITYTMSAINALMNWTIGILPFFIFWGLSMERKTKFLFAGILAFAAVGSTASVVRIGYISHLKNGTNFLYATTDVAIWSIIEPGIGIAAGNMATLCPLIRSFLERKEPTNALDRESNHQSGRSHNRKDHHEYQRPLSPSCSIPIESSSTVSTKIFAQKIPHNSTSEGTLSGDMLTDSKRPIMKLSKKSSFFDRHIKQTVTVEHAYEGAPRIHLRDSFRNSFSRGTMISLGQFSELSK